MCTENVHNTNCIKHTEIEGQEQMNHTQENDCIVGTVCKNNHGFVQQYGTWGVAPCPQTAVGMEHKARH